MIHFEYEIGVAVSDVNIEYIYSFLNCSDFTHLILLFDVYFWCQWTKTLLNIKVENPVYLVLKLHLFHLKLGLLCKFPFHKDTNPAQFNPFCSGTWYNTDYALVWKQRLNWWKQCSIYF